MATTPWTRLTDAVEGDDDNVPEVTSARKAFFPSSMGLSVLVPRDTTKLQVRISWADYAPMVQGEGNKADGASKGEATKSGEPEGESDPGGRFLGWRRLSRDAEVALSRSRRATRRRRTSLMARA